MDALPPSLPGTGLPQPLPAGTAGLAILLAELTQALAKLPAGTQIPALVTAILPQPTAAPDPAAATAKPPPPTMLLQLSTPDGAAQIRVPATVQIPAGAKLEITVAASGPQPQWRLATIDGKPVSPTPVTIITTAPPPPVSAPAPTIAPIVNTPRPTTAPGIPATLVKSADPALPSGTTLLVRITNLVPPQAPQAQPQPLQPQEQEVGPAPAALAEEPETAPAPAALPAQTQAPVAAPHDLAAVQIPTPSSAPAATQPPQVALPSPTAAPAPTQTQTVALPPPAAAPAAATIPAPGPLPTSAPVPVAPSLPMASPIPTAIPALAPAPAPAAAIPVPAPAPPPTEIAGEILSNSDAGRPLVKTPVGLLALSVEPQSAPPAGAHVTLTVIGKPVPPAAPLLPPPPPDEPRDLALPRRLTELVEQVQNSGNGKLAEAVRQAIPAPGAKLAAQLLSVIASAEPSQGLPRWLGEGLATVLTHSAPEAMAQLSRQWETLSQPVQGPDNGDWRTLLLPLMMGGQMNLLRLTTRNPRRGATPAEREKGTRFLLDLDLSRLGPMQFDGLVKRQYKHFDLIIRTRDPLPGEMRRDIDGLFQNGLLNFGLEGSVVFQADRRFIATPRLTGDTNGIIFA